MCLAIGDISYESLDNLFRQVSQYIVKLSLAEDNERGRLPGFTRQNNIGSLNESC